MIDLIEGRLDVKLNHPVVSPAPLSGDSNGLFRRSSRSISIGIRMKDRVEYRLDDALDYGLCDSVRHSGYTRPSRAALCLRNLYLLHRRRKVRTRRHPIPQFVQILRQVLFEHRDGFIVDARSTPVGLDLLVRFPYCAFRNDIRFCRCHIHSSPHDGLATFVDRITLPFAPPSLQGLHHYCGQLRPSSWHRYSSSWCLPFVISLAIQNEVLTFHTKACIEIMPPIHRLPSGP